MKLTAFGEQFDGGRDVFVQQEGAHVHLSVECTSGDNAGRVLLTPAQARAISDALLKLAADSDHFAAEMEGAS